jgi:hypothetical protein
MSDLILAYADVGHHIFPVANKTPLVPHWRVDATCDHAVIEGWRRRLPYAQWALALTGAMVVADIDYRPGQNGFADFLRLAGMPVDEVAAPLASTAHGGRHVFYATGGRRYVNRRVAGASIDIKTEGGYVVLPSEGNGREWLKPLLDATLPPAPAWLDGALWREPIRSPAEAPDLPPTEYDRDFAREALARARARIAFAPCGEQDTTRHRECFFIGLLVGRGVLDREEALAALTRAALAMPTYGKPWRDLEERVEKSLEAGERQAEAAP